MSALSVTTAEPPLHSWLRRLSLIALGDPPGSVADAAEVIGRATGSRGAVLWESPQSSDDAGELSVLATWRHPGVPRLNETTLRPDQVTREADLRRTLALPQRVAVSLMGLSVDGALPVDYADGSRGVVTLCGAGELSGAAFDTATELLTILPEVFTVIRERRTLALVNASDDILHRADLASGTKPLTREELLHYFEEVCAKLSEALHGAQISLYLRECELDVLCGYAVGSPTERPSDRAAVDPTEACRPSLEPDAVGISEELTNGNHVWGVLRCRPVAGPPAYFTHSDRSLLRPVAAQLARYWENWLNRRAIFEENESWRHLADGITDFNKTLADALRRGGGATARQAEVVTAALRVASSVVPEATASAVYIAPRGCPPALSGRGERPSLTLACFGECDDVSPAARAQAETAYLSRTQRTTDGTSPEVGDGPDSGWIVSTPIGVGHQVYGALTAEGPGAVAPPNSAQVYDILSDQLGLYRHLAHTMDDLKTAQRKLNANLTEQAEAMEDLKHQLVSPLRAATDRTDLVLSRGRFDSRTQRELEAARGLCRKASRVAMSAGVFATLSKGRLPNPRTELLGSGDLQRMLIAAAADCQILSDPDLRRRFTVDRAAVDGLGRQCVQADSSFLQQCVGNLLDNADKYSYPETEVIVTAAVTGPQFAIKVVSTGVPLPLDDHPRCLERNWRGEAARRLTGEGSGIGLWIVDHLMKSMKGRVELEPAGESLTVALILPLS
jgi:signal transduction histidine kinase